MHFEEGWTKYRAILEWVGSTALVSSAVGEGRSFSSVWGRQDRMRDCISTYAALVVPRFLLAWTLCWGSTCVYDLCHGAVVLVFYRKKHKSISQPLFFEIEYCISASSNLPLWLYKELRLCIGSHSSRISTIIQIVHFRCNRQKVCFRKCSTIWNVFFQSMFFSRLFFQKQAYDLFWRLVFRSIV